MTDPAKPRRFSVGLFLVAAQFMPAPARLAAQNTRIILLCKEYAESSIHSGDCQSAHNRQPVTNAAFIITNAAELPVPATVRPL